MRRTPLNACLALGLLLVGTGCGEEAARESAAVPEIRGAPLFVPPEPAPAEPAVVDPAVESGPAGTADPQGEPAGASAAVAAATDGVPGDPLPADPDPDPDPDVDVDVDVAIGDPSAPLSEPPPPAVPETSSDPASEEDVVQATAPQHSGVGGSGDAPVELKFPEPDEKGLIFVTFEQLAAFEYLPPGGPRKAPAASGGDGPPAPKTGAAGAADDPTAVAPLADALRRGGSTIPEPIRRLSGKKIEVEGYMIPLRFDDGKVKSFFLSRHLQGCCFGIVPRVNDVIEVEMVADGDAYYDAYMPIIVTGPFEVREDAGDPAYLQTIYYMKGETTRFAEDW